MTITVTATDDCGLTETADFTFDITDTEAPTASNPNPVNVECIEDIPDPDPLVVTDEADNCTASPTVAFVSDVSDGNSCPQVITRTYSVTDDCGNHIEVTQQITIDDDQDPVITQCPENKTFTAPPPDCEVVIEDIDPLQYTDNCTSGTSVTWELRNEAGDLIASGDDDVNGTFFPTGINTVTYTVTDLCENVATCSFTVTVNDQVPPREVTCDNTPIVVHATAGECDALISPPVPTAVDPCNEIFSVTHDSEYGPDEFDATGYYPVGTTIVNWYATDRSGNTALICTQEITVIDDQVLAIECPGNVTELADDGELFATGIDYGVYFGDPTLHENCHLPELSWTMVPPAGYETEYTSGELAGTGIFIGTGKYWLGVSTITYTYTDTLNNSVDCQFTITIEAKPDIECPPSRIVSTEELDCDSTFNPGEAYLISGGQPITWTWTMYYPDMSTVVGTGSSVTTNLDPAPLPIVTDAPHEYDFQLGTTTIVWHAQNAAGYDECTQTITVVDETPPVILDLDPLEECVEPIQSATFNTATEDITPERPDYVIFEEGSTLLDIDVPDFSDNCDLTFCPPFKVRWRIDFADGSSLPPAGDPLGYYEGQPSEQDFPSDEILFPGDENHLQDLTHVITYWIVDCNGNVSASETRNFVVKPRPNLEKTTN